jgi:AcrR family transcriptional regulator
MVTNESGRMPEGRRRLLVRTAAAEFARSGFRHASLNRIIKECGMSKSSFYHFVGSKQMLFDLVVSEAGAALTAALRIPAPGDLTENFWAEMARLIRAIADVGRYEPWLEDFGRLYYVPDAPREPGSALALALDRMDVWLAEVIAVGRSAGEIRADLPPDLQARLTFAVLQVMDDWSLKHLDAMPAAQRQTVAETQFDTVRRLLAPG